MLHSAEPSRGYRCSVHGTVHNWTRCTAPSELPTQYIRDWVGRYLVQSIPMQPSAERTVSVPSHGQTGRGVHHDAAQCRMHCVGIPTQFVWYWVARDKCGTVRDWVGRDVSIDHRHALSCFSGIVSCNIIGDTASNFKWRGVSPSQ